MTSRASTATDRRAWIRWRPVASPWIARAFVSCGLMSGPGRDRRGAVDCRRPPARPADAGPGARGSGPGLLGSALRRGRPGRPDRTRAPADQRRAVARRDLRAWWPASASTSATPTPRSTRRQRVQEVDYGWSWQYVGDRALVDWVDDGSDARAKGLRVGDAVRGGLRVHADAGHSPDASPTSCTSCGRSRSSWSRWSATVPAAALTMLSKFRKQRKRLDVDNELDRHVMQDAVGLRGSGGPEAEAGVARARRPVLAHAALLPQRVPVRIRWTTSSARQRQLVLDLRGNPGGSDRRARRRRRSLRPCRARRCSR